MAKSFTDWFLGLFGHREATAEALSPEEFNAEMRRRTEAVRAQQRAEAQAALQADDDEMERREQEFVQQILSNVPQLMAVAADAGVNQVRVMKLESLVHFKRPAEAVLADEFDPDWLFGPARAVYDRCVETGRSPTVELFPGGVKHSHQMIIHW